MVEQGHEEGVGPASTEDEKVNAIGGRVGNGLGISGYRCGGHEGELGIGGDGVVGMDLVGTGFEDERRDFGQHMESEVYYLDTTKEHIVEFSSEIYLHSRCRFY